MKVTKVHKTPACPYTYPHKSRLAKVEYICGIGGYSRFCDDRFPIEFNVAAYDTDFSFENIWEKYVDDEWRIGNGHTPEECAAYYRLAKRLHKENEAYLWGWGQEDAVHGLMDDDAYRMLWDGTEVAVKLELHGRGGKHLVIAEFEGMVLRGMDASDLFNHLMAQFDDFDETSTTHTVLRKGNTWYRSAKEVDLLYRYVRQCEIDFTQAKAAAEIEYQGAWQFFNNIVEPAWEEEKKRLAEHAAVVGCAQTLRRYLAEKEGAAVLQMLRTLSQAAGVAEEELWAGN